MANMREIEKDLDFLTRTALTTAMMTEVDNLPDSELEHGLALARDRQLYLLNILATEDTFPRNLKNATHSYALGIHLQEMNDRMLANELLKSAQRIEDALSPSAVGKLLNRLRY